MKKHLLLIAAVSFAGIVSAQSAKMVSWNFSSKKIADKVYEVHLSASLNPGWHIYAQNVGVEGPLPTAITLTNNPLASLSGKTKEVGAVIRKKEEVWGGTVNYYEKSVDFVQQVKLRGNVKTNLAGKIEFMVCNDKECLPPSEVPFKVNVGG